MISSGVEFAIIPVVRNRIHETGMSVKSYSFFTLLTLGSLVGAGWTIYEGVRGFNSRNNGGLECQPRQMEPMYTYHYDLLPLERYVGVTGRRDITVFLKDERFSTSASSEVAVVMKRFPESKISIEYLSNSRGDVETGKLLEDCSTAVVYDEEAESFLSRS